MVSGIAEIVLIALLLDFLFNKIKTPGLVGMMLLGMLLGPHMLNQLDPSIVNVSSDLRHLALVVILLRAGLKLDLNTLRKHGSQLALLAIMPAVTEILIITLEPVPN